MLCITFTYHLPAEIYKQSPKKRSKWCLSRASKVYCGRSTATLGTAGWLQVTAWQHEFHWMLGNIREASIQHYFTNFLVNNVKYLLIHHTLYFIILSEPMKKCKDKSYINQWKKCKDKSYIQQNRSKQQFIDSSHFKSVNSRHVAVATPATRSPSWAPAARPIFQIRRMNTQVMAMLGKNVETGDIYNQRLTLINDG